MAGRSRYSTVAIILHWTIAALILFQLSLGFRLEELEGPIGYAAIQAHKSIGVTILALSLARGAWRLGHRAPPSPAGSPRWERAAAAFTHAGFYVMMIGVPLSGWALVSTSRLGIPTVLYGAVPWPHLPMLADLPAAEKAAAHAGAENAHLALSLLTVALLVLHVGAVLKHQLIDRDEVLSHMAPGARPARRGEPRLWLALATAALAVTAPWLLLRPATAPAEPAAVQAQAMPQPPASTAAPAEEAVPPPADAPEAASTAAEPAAPSAWAVQRGSRLTFTARWSGTPIEGRFEDWTADILFAPEALDASRLTVKVKVASAETGDGQRDASLDGPDWFDAAAHPTATFTAQDFRRLGPDRYEARGRLTLRGVSAPVTLPFTLKIDGDTAKATGRAVLERTTFGVGQGEWAATDQIAGPVSVAFDLTAKRR